MGGVAVWLADFGALPGARFVAAWSAFAALLLAEIWIFVISSDPARTKRRAAQSDPGKHAVLILVLLASCMGFSAAVLVLGEASSQHAREGFSVALAVLAIALSWTLIHTTMTLRYAHLFYATEPGGGMIFPQTPEPSDSDFAYFAFVVGMTFQTSDVSIADSAIRRLVVVHGAVSFIYNVAIIAVAVNIGTGLLH